MKAIIMAGGEGRRLKPITGDMPKPLVPLCGRPVMEHIILLLRRHGITDICAALKYRPDDIKNYFGSGEKLGVSIEYRVEQNALPVGSRMPPVRPFMMPFTFAQRMAGTA